MIKKKQKGFNLVELMVSVAIMSFLFLLSAPTYSAWSANLRVRNVSESIQSGMLQARSEAIRRNQPIVFTINNDTSWTVTVASDNLILNKKDAQEFSATTGLAFSPAGSNSVTFNGFGSVMPNIDATDRVEDIDVSTTSGFEGVTNLRVRVGRGGSVILCSPSVTDQDDTRFCRDI